MLKKFIVGPVVLASLLLAACENRGTAYAKGMLEPVNPREIKAGSQGEKYHDFLFNKDEFEILKNFKLEFGPFIGDNGKALFKEKMAEFNLLR
ncbi:hypothetical protein ABEV54_21735 [Peribacillus psychrosaccharolyticus]|uniref:hypothetical protein n=1 Tax=Peribacillus psychrosaccharolyticus TaxID=1407 RepID=UPI003D2DB1C2